MRTPYLIKPVASTVSPGGTPINLYVSSTDNPISGREWLRQSSSISIHTIGITTTRFSNVDVLYLTEHMATNPLQFRSLEEYVEPS